MSSGKAVNTQATVKRRGKGKPFANGYDERRNYNGAPKRGESWTELIKSVGKMTGPEIAAFAAQIGREFSKLPSDVDVRTLVIVRTYGALLNEPSPGLLNSFMDREEGKVVDKVAHEGGITLHVVYDRPNGNTEDAA